MWGNPTLFDLLKKILRKDKYWHNQLWLLKCCKNKNSYDMKIYFHSIKTTLYLIKYIFIISPFFSWYQNRFLFNQNKFLFNKMYFHYITFFFHDIKICFHLVKINLYSARNIFITYIFFHSSEVYFYCMDFSLNTFLVILFHLYFKWSEFYFQYVNWTAARGREKAAKKDIRILCYER